MSRDYILVSPISYVSILVQRFGMSKVVRWLFVVNDCYNTAMLLYHVLMCHVS